MEVHMPELVCELIITLDGFARGQRSPGYYGYFGPDVAEWITTNTAVPHRMLNSHSYTVLSFRFCDHWTGSYVVGGPSRPRRIAFVRGHRVTRTQDSLS